MVPGRPALTSRPGNADHREDALISRKIAYPFVTRKQYLGVRFPATEPFEQRLCNGRIGAL